MVSRSQPARPRDLLDATEAGAHHLGLVAEFLVVVIDARDRLHARVLVGRDLRAAVLAVPVVDAPHERRDQRDARLGARHGLREAEKQREVAVDALALEVRGGPDALPRAAHLDQDPLARDARALVEADQLARLGDGARRVEAEARIHFRRHPARHDLQDLAAEVDGEPIHERFRPARLGQAQAPRVGQGGLDERPVLRLLRRLQEERRIGRGVLRPELPHGLDVAGVGDDGGDLLQGVEQRHSGTG